MVLGDFLPAYKGCGVFHFPRWLSWYRTDLLLLVPGINRQGLGVGKRSFGGIGWSFLKGFDFSKPWLGDVFTLHDGSIFLKYFWSCGELWCGGFHHSP